MAELLRLESARLYGNHSSGCVWSFFHVFDSNQLRETRKLLSYRRMIDMQDSVGNYIHIENDNAAREDIVGHKVTNIIEEQKVNKLNKSSGKARILKFISTKLLRRQKHRVKTPHSTCQLMDAISNSTFALNLNVTDSGTTSEHESSASSLLHGVDGMQGEFGAMNTGNNVGYLSHNFDDMGNHLLDEHIILKEKLFEARDALLKHKYTDPKGMTTEFLMLSKIFLDTLQLFNANREVLCNVCNGQISSLAKDRQAFGSNKSLSHYGSVVSGNAEIPVSSCTHLEDNSVINRGPISKSIDLPVDNFGFVPSIEVLPVSQEQRKQRESKTVLSRLRMLKQRIKGVIVENRKERHRISMDRILHKVPSGRKLVDDEEDHKLHIKDGSVPEKYYKGGQGFKMHKIVPNSIQRSRSFAESLDRYSQLLDSISSNERRAPERSNSAREGRGLLQSKLPNTYERMLSNPELLRSYSYSKDFQTEANLAKQSSRKEISEPDEGSDKLNNAPVMLPAVEEIACEEKESLESNIMVNAIKTIVSDKISAHNLELSSTATKGHGRQPDSISIVEEASVWFNNQESPVDDSPSIKPQKKSPISVLDFNIEEEPVSPLKLTSPAGSDDDHKDQHPISEPCNHSNEPNVAEMPNPDSLPDHVDEKDAAEFTYVKNILSKSGYNALFLETRDSFDEFNMGNHMLCDMPCEEQLMHDLIQEVLLEIYEYSTAPSSWLPHFHPKTRSMPTGSYLLEEVWACIRWHLSSSQGFTDDVVARNFAKDGSWMNLFRDAECYGMLLEQLILDDLVDEVVLDSL